MTARRAVWEVARREVVERSRSRALRVSLALLLVLGIGGAVAAARHSGRTPTDKIGVVGARSLALEPAVRLQARAAGRRAHVRRLPTVAAAAHALRDGAVTVVLIDGTRLMVKTSSSSASVRVVRNAVATEGVVDQLRASGLTRAQAARALTPAALPVEVLEPNARNTEENRNLVFIGVLSLYTLLMFFGQAVAQGITEEKSSRVVELLLTTVSPRRLLAGKVLGIGIVGLGLLALPAAAAVVAGSLAGGAGLPSAAPGAVALVVLWFVLGYALYSVAFAAVGALVSRQEDLQTAIVPIVAVMTGGFLLTAAISDGDPDGTLAQVGAFVPAFSPMIVPARTVLGHMGALPMAATIALDLLATVGLVILAARIYERAVLRIGAPVKLQRLFADRRHAATPSPTTTKDGLAMKNRPRLSPMADVALRIAAVALLLTGVALGFDQALAIVLAIAGVLLLTLEHALKHGGSRPVR